MRGRKQERECKKREDGGRGGGFVDTGMWRGDKVSSE